MNKDTIIIDDPDAPTSADFTPNAPTTDNGEPATTTRSMPDLTAAMQRLFGRGRNPPRSVRKAPSWWAERQADMIERRRRGEAPAPKPARPEAPPQMTSAGPLDRPEGMTRQMHRRLYRDACKIAGVKPKRGT